MNSVCLNLARSVDYSIDRQIGKGRRRFANADCLISSGDEHRVCICLRVYCSRCDAQPATSPHYSACYLSSVRDEYLVEMRAIAFGSFHPLSL